MRFYPLEQLINLHDDYSRQFKIDHLQLLLLQRAGELFLIEATCPHRAHRWMSPVSTAASFSAPCTSISSPSWTAVCYTPRKSLAAGYAPLT